MSTLRSALDELKVEDLAHRSDGELLDDLGELERASRTLEAERARRTAEVERRGACAEDGYLSVIAWLVHRLGVAASAARSQVRLGRSLQRMPGTRHALLEGEIAVAAALLLADAQVADPEEFARSELMLVDLARRLPVRDLIRAIEHWKMLADPRASERRFARRALYVSPTLDGMVRVDGDLDPETGQTLITAIRSMVDRSARGDGTDLRTPAQRRADALGEICRKYLGSSDRPVVAGERPHVLVSVDLQALQGSGGRAELQDAGPITPEAARRLACDADLSRVITRGPVRAARARQADPGRAAGPAASGDRARPGLPVPRVRQTSGLERRASRRALGRRRRDLALQPGAALQAAPPDGARAVRGGDDRRAAGVQTGRRVGAGGTGAAVAATVPYGRR
jgi:hypothetical protein